MIPPPTPGDVVWFRNRGTKGFKPTFLVVAGPPKFQLNRYEKLAAEVRKKPHLEIEYSTRHITFSFDVYGPRSANIHPELFTIHSYLYDIVYVNRENQP